MNLSTISHTEVDACRLQTKSWVAQRLTSKPSFRMIGYNQTLLGGIYRFHKTGSAKDAQAHLQELLKNRDFKDLDRVALLEESLEDYLEWFGKSDSASADYRVRLKYKMGFLELGAKFLGWTFSCREDTARFSFVIRRRIGKSNLGCH